jgi:SAM-dependent methyltransferase
VVLPSKYRSNGSEATVSLVSWLPMTRDSRGDWARYSAERIPTKKETPELEVFLDTMGPGGRLLDLGCGSGRISRELAKRGYDVTGVDINKDAVTNARLGAGLGEGLQFHVRDIAATDGLDLDDAVFRFAVCQLVISVVGGVNERKALLENALSVLEPGGSMYLSASEVSDDVNPGYRKLYLEDFPETHERHSYYSRDADGNILYMTHHFTGIELSALLDEVGFELVRLSSKTESSSRRPDEAAHFLYAVCRRPPPSHHGASE